MKEAQMSSQPWLVPVTLAFLAGFACTIFLSRSRTTLVLGGFAILVAVAGAAWGAGILVQVHYLLLAMALLFAAGLWSDVSNRGDRANLAIQVIATTLIVGVADVQLRSLGDIFGMGRTTLPALLSLPLTVFAILAVAHSVSMMDGLRGFRAGFAFVALAWFTAAAAISGLPTQFQIGLVLVGAIGGYLVSNLALMKRPYSRVLLGSAGGLMIGFTLGWLATDLTQGRARGYPLAAALWVLMLPLANGFSVLLRRAVRGRDLFQRDDEQIHDYLCAKGFSQGEALLMLIVASAFLGAVGYAGWRFRVPDLAMYLLAIAAFAVYHVWMTRNWRRITGFTVVMT
jgi:UDP-GlcNAc:undecaprenyl-phosphate/decaprenyl-phosphate GlcNAc-1-phosphate transferase